MDQWKDKPGDKVRPVTARLISSLHRQQYKNGTWFRASDNADAFSIIERR